MLSKLGIGLPVFSSYEYGAVSRDKFKINDTDYSVMLEENESKTPYWRINTKEGLIWIGTKNPAEIDKMLLEVMLQYDAGQFWKQYRAFEERESAYRQVIQQAA